MSASIPTDPLTQIQCPILSPFAELLKSRPWEGMLRSMSDSSWFSFGRPMYPLTTAALTTAAPWAKDGSTVPDYLSAARGALRYPHRSSADHAAVRGDSRHDVKIEAMTCLVRLRD